MKIAFIGGVKFSHDVLSEILKNGWEISVVFTYNDNKRKFFSDFSYFDDLEQQYSFKHVKVNNINDVENVELLKKIQPDLILVMGWSQLLKTEIISIPKLGVIGSHPTELPKYRGRAPIPWSIIKELKESALTFFYIEEGVDDGDILEQQNFLIDLDDDATSIYEKVTHLGRKMILSSLSKIQSGTEKRIKQEPSLFIENWPKRTPEDGKIDWNDSSKNVLKLIRASTFPYPGAFSFYDNKKIIIWTAKSLNEQSIGVGIISSISENGIKVGTLDKNILLTKIQINEEIVDFKNSIFIPGKNFQIS